MGRASTMYRSWMAIASASVVFLAACGGGSDEPGSPSGPTAAGIAIVGGNFQLAHYGTAVAQPLKVKLTNATGGPVAGVQVVFTPGTGSGTVTGNTVSSDANGIATLGSWTLGAAPGPNTLTAVAGSLTTTFSATATAGAASAMTITDGNNQNGIERSQVATALKVTVTDGQYPVRGAQVDFAVASGGGTVVSPNQTTDANGVATLSTWKLGNLGTNTVTATVRNSSIPAVTFTATAAALVLKPMLMVEGAAMGGFYGNIAPKQARVELRNQFDQPAEGVQVTFTVTSGGGSIVKGVDTTGTDGRAEVGTWRLGNSATQTLSAAVTNIASPPAPVTMTANATPVPASTFHITVRYQGALPNQAVQDAFTAAANKWQSVIVGDLEDIVTTATDTMESVIIGGRVCVPVIKNETIDDVVIYATVAHIDGPGAILGFATPIYTRTSDSTAISGCMVFDEDDLDMLQQAGQLVATITHEMGHVLGSGTMSMTKSVGVCDPETGIGGVPYFLGSSARQAFRAALGNGVVWSQQMVPLEATGSCFDGTHDAHWSEGIFRSELMTGYIDQFSNPLSAITASQMRDINYTVNDLTADAYTVPFGLPTLRMGASTGTKLNEMPVTEPIRTVNSRGRITGLIQR